MVSGSPGTYCARQRCQDLQRRAENQADTQDVGV